MIPIADEIKRALKARYDEKQWLTVNQSIQDVLREQRRDVLVDWLVAHPDPKAGQTWTNATGLSEHYLIDVETNAVVLTSRLKQATASASMFVQRILLGLESDILASNAADPQAEAAGLDAPLPGLGSEPQGISLSRELDRTGATGRKIILLP